MMLAKRFACVALLAALPAACSGDDPSPPSTVANALSDLRMTSVARLPAATHRDRRGSWRSPELAGLKTALLFVSDAGTADVYIYRLTSLKLTATITGFTQPQGECSDAKGDVWVTDTAGQTVYQLTHHGQLENEFTDSSNPAACAWDATTGNLAVMNLFGSGSTSGGVLVYASGTGSPKLYQNSAQYYYNFGGYDASGNLFFDGRDANGNFMLSELPKGASSAHTVTISGGTIYYPGMVEWDATKRELVVGDQSCGNVYSSCVYALKISKSTGTIRHKTMLQTYNGAQVCDMVQGTLDGKRIVGSDYDFCGSATSATYVWPYPLGGGPESYNDKTDAVPVGATISR